MGAANGHEPTLIVLRGQVRRVPPESSHAAAGSRLHQWPSSCMTLSLREPEAHRLGLCTSLLRSRCLTPRAYRRPYWQSFRRRRLRATPPRPGLRELSGDRVRALIESPSPPRAGDGSLGHGGSIRARVILTWQGGAGRSSIGMAVRVEINPAAAACVEGNDHTDKEEDQNRKEY